MSEMSETLFMRAFRGEATPRRPLWIMRQAGRYLPEYRALKERHSFEQICAEPELAVEVTLQPLRRFPLDAAIVFADLVTPLAALGVDFRFDPGPVIGSPVRTAGDIERLREPVAGEIAPATIEALRLLRRELPAGTALLGFAGAPWSLAAYLTEGRGKEGFPTIRSMAAAAPDSLDRLLTRLARLSAAYAIDQHRAGADAVQIFDTWAGLLSLADWKRIVRPHLLWLLEEIGRAGVPRILFLLDAPHLLEAAVELPAEALAIDWRLDLAEVRRKVGPERALQGNLDPAILLAGPETTAREARALLARVPSRGHIANLGHGILPDTPIASVEAFVDAVHAEEISR